jgi:hypothetical protein
MKKNLLFLPLACFFLIGPSYVFSQKADSLLGIYRANYRQEKIHIHFADPCIPKVIPFG